MRCRCPALTIPSAKIDRTTRWQARPLHAPSPRGILLYLPCRPCYADRFNNAILSSVGADVKRMASEIQSISTECIRIRGARMHNLRNVDLDIPRNRLVVMTGPSGSGKSSLAFDTLYAEGQRQYIESLSTYARQFLHQLERPDVDLIEGLQPTISIDQRAGSHNPRSTVATVTEIYDYLRLLFARLGEPRCYQCGAADPPANAGADSRRPAGTERGHAGDDPRAPGARTKGRAQGSAGIDPQAGLPPRPGRRRSDRREPSARPGRAEVA